MLGYVALGSNDLKKAVVFEYGLVSAIGDARMIEDDAFVA